MRYFVDSWYFVALWNRFDESHAAAERIQRRVSQSGGYTHDGVLSEVLAHFSRSGAINRRQAVVNVRRAFYDLTVEPVTRELFALGLERYARRLDKEYSHVDCVSMVLMEQLGIQHVLSNDHHFSQEGFTLVNA